jgi:predicted transcriptional regulator
MPDAVTRRKARFLRALAVTGQSQAAWADEVGVSPAHLSFVLNGKRESGKLVGKIDAFIREHQTKQQNAA